MTVSLKFFLILFFTYFCATAYADDGHMAELKVRDASISVVFDNAKLWQKKEIILPWIDRSAEVIARYLGQFPVKNLNIALIGDRGNRVHSGVVFGGEVPIINVRLGNRVTAKKLKEDWVMVHEMAHLAFPEVSQRWMEEGMATYVESVARANAGDLQPKVVWRELIKRMPQGQPVLGDRGLDGTPSWGRTYWGGAVFCLVADVEIRRQTNNRYGLQDAFRGILAAGLSINKNAQLSEVLAAGDKAVGVSVLSDLYRRHAHAPLPFELDKVWQELGLELSGRTVTYILDAPLAHVRAKIIPD